jgi:Ca-activated chloride channel family protein
MLPADQSFLIGFGNQIRLISPFTHDSDRLLERLTRSQKDDIDQFPRIGPREIREGGTAFYDAVHTACEDLLSRADTGRRALILFSDGEDNASAHHLLDAIECAQRVGATIFSLRYTDLRNGRWTARNKYGRSVMERLARETGGLDFDAGESDNLRASFRQIADLLRASYDLAYKSSHTEEDGAFRKIQIRSKRPGVTLRHKTGYFARTPESGVR